MCVFFFKTSSNHNWEKASFDALPSPSIHTSDTDLYVLAPRGRLRYTVDHIVHCLREVFRQAFPRQLVLLDLIDLEADLVQRQKTYS